MRSKTLVLFVIAGMLSTMSVWGQTPSPNFNTAGQQDVSPGATVVGIGPGGGMRGGQVSEGVGANWSTINMSDRSMGSTITGTGQFTNAMTPGVGSNFSTLYGRGSQSQGVVTFEFGRPNQGLPYGPGANINTAVGRSFSVESAAINGWSNQYGGGGWQTNGLAPPGVGANFTTVNRGNLSAEQLSASATPGGRSFARGTQASQQAGYATQFNDQGLGPQTPVGFGSMPVAGQYGDRFFWTGLNGASSPNYGGMPVAGQYGNRFFWTGINGVNSPNYGRMPVAGQYGTGFNGTMFPNHTASLGSGFYGNSLPVNGGY